MNAAGPDASALYLVAADAILVVHALFVAYVVLGLGLIIAGKLCDWHWVRNLWFRLTHLAAIAVVVAQAWLDTRCPLTVLEMWLRSRAGAATYGGDFIGHWVSRFLYYAAPHWVFVVAYTIFGALVVYAWLAVPPRWRRRSTTR